MSGLVRGRPVRRAFEPSYFFAQQPAIPPQDGVRCDNAGDGRQAAADDVAFHGQTAALVVGEAQASGSLRCAEDPVLLEQVVNHRLLFSIDPTGE
jgi:hypothetical protein